MEPLDKKSEMDGSKREHVGDHLLILHNDEINTFDHVIHSLREICMHEKEQAEQCAMITHLRGQCEIKKGILSQLEELQKQLRSKSLNVTID